MTTATLPLPRYSRPSWIDLSNTDVPRLAQTQPIAPKVMAALPVIVKSAQIERQSLSLKLKQSERHGTELFNKFDEMNRVKPARMAEMHHQQKLSAQRVMRLVQHPAITEKRGQVALDYTLREAAKLRDQDGKQDLLFKNMDDRAYRQHAEEAIWQKRRQSVAIKSPHMTPGLAPKVNAGKITAFGGVRAARDRHVSDDVQEQKLDAMHHEKDCKLETDYQSKKTWSTLEKRRGSTIGAINAPIRPPEPIRPIVQYDNKGLPDKFRQDKQHCGSLTRSRMNKRAAEEQALMERYMTSPVITSQSRRSSLHSIKSLSGFGFG